MDDPTNSGTDLGVLLMRDLISKKAKLENTHTLLNNIVIAIKIGGHTPIPPRSETLTHNPLHGKIP